jgi:hypothetical protein
VTICTDTETGQPTTDQSLCIPKTGNDEAAAIGIAACVVTAFGLAMLGVRRGRPDHRGNIA